MQSNSRPCYVLPKITPKSFEYQKAKLNHTKLGFAMLDHTCRKILLYETEKENFAGFYRTELTIVDHHFIFWYCFWYDPLHNLCVSKGSFLIRGIY